MTGTTYGNRQYATDVKNFVVKNARLRFYEIKEFRTG